MQADDRAAMTASTCQESVILACILVDRGDSKLGQERHVARQFTRPRIYSVRVEQIGDDFYICTQRQTASRIRRHGGIRKRNQRAYRMAEPLGPECISFQWWSTKLSIVEVWPVAINTTRYILRLPAGDLFRRKGKGIRWRGPGTWLSDYDGHRCCRNQAARRRPDNEISVSQFELCALRQTVLALGYNS